MNFFEEYLVTVFTHFHQEQVSFYEANKFVLKKKWLKFSDSLNELKRDKIKIQQSLVTIINHKSILLLCEYKYPDKDIVIA